MALTHGMNVEEVKTLGRFLQQQQTEIDRIVKSIEAKVNGTGWEGPDAKRFKNEWWPQHRQHLHKMGQDLNGFGQSALNNATEQENVSRR